MNEEHAAANGQKTCAIAVVGMACRFPGDATNIEALWEMLRDAKDAWSEIPSDRFNAKGWYHPNPNRPGSFHIRGAHFLKGDIAAFDAPFFSISTAEAVSMDPQQRMLLEVVYEALDSAGIPAASLSNTATSVFCGSFVRDYEQPCMRDPDTTPAYSATGNGIAILANRISHAFDFAGTSQTIDTGCSASMIAVHQACKSLIDGESSLGIAAGVGLIFSPNTLVPMANLNILSPDGRCFTFDERANGYGRGEGVGVVVLKRLEDAIASNDTIRAVIRATATNQDGHTQGITLPSKERQIQNMAGIYRNAGLDISRTAYVECHGTGTKAGDLKEAQAVSEVFCQHRTADNPLTVGSVKTNIGHLEGSAGVAGLLKGILVAERGYIPKHLNYTSANPNINFRDMKLQVASDLMPWPVHGLRRVSVNSFGFGGTNAHVVLDDAPHFLAEHNISGGQHASFVYPNDCLSMQESRPPRRQNRLFVFSGHDASGLNRVMATQAGYIETHSCPSDFAANYAYTLFSRRSALNWRTFAIATSAEELVQKLEKRDVAPPVRMPSHAQGGIALVFSGQGAQWHAMGRELLRYQPFHESVSAACRYMSVELQSPFNLWYELHNDAECWHIDEPQIAQPATTVIQVALVDLLTASGIRPAAVVGHSSGEIAAAYAFGAIRREDAWKIAYHRGQCVSRISTLAPDMHGGMLVVALPEDDARRMIDDAGIDSVGVACINGPASVTLSGDADAINDLCRFFGSKGMRAIRVNVNVAYHSSHMRIVEEVYLDAIQDVVPLQQEPVGQFFSSVFGRVASAKDLDARYWVNNLVLPVRFYQAVTAMIGQVNPAVLLEVSPHRVWKSTLCQICSEVSAKKADRVKMSPIYASLLCRGEDASATALHALGELWMKGFTLNLDWTFSDKEIRPRHLVDVPSYPWDHSRKYWHESHLSKTNRFRAHGREDLIGAPLENSTPQFPRWRGFFRVQENPWLEDHVVQKSIIYPAGGMVAMAIEAAKQLADAGRKVLGYEVLEFSIVKPMLIPRSPQGLENMLSATLVNQANSCYNFSILSKSDEEPWIVHATGRFAVLYGSEDEDGDERCITSTYRQSFHRAREACETEYNPRQFYECLDIIGMTYGPQFRNLTEIRTDDAAAYTVIQTPDTKAHMPFHFEFDHVIHPATLDTMLQTVLAIRNQDQTDEAMLPCSAARIFISASLPRGAGSQFRGYTTARKTSTHSVRADISMFDYALEKPVVTIENLVLKSVPSQAGAGNDSFLPAHRNLCAEMVWKPDISLFSALGVDFPDTVQDIVDFSSHKKPNLSVLCHAGAFGVDSGKDDTAFGLANLVFDVLTVGYDTPRFSKLTVAGSEVLWQQLCASKKTHSGWERVHFSAEPCANGLYDVVLCLVDSQIPDDNVTRLCERVTPGGWMAMVPAKASAFPTANRSALCAVMEAHGFHCHGSRAGLIRAQKAWAVASRPTTRMTIVLPDEMSDFVRSLLDAIRPIVEAELSAEIIETPLSAIRSLPRGALATPCLCLAELDSPVLFSMGKDTFDAVRQILLQTKGLLWLTCGAQLDVKDPRRHPFIGLARTLRSEDAKKSIVSLDLAGDSMLWGGKTVGPEETIVSSIVLLLQHVCAGDVHNDVEYVYSGGRLLIPRLMPLTTLNRLIEHGSGTPQAVSRVSLTAGNKALKLDASSIGKPCGPLFVEDEQGLGRLLCPDEVRIAVVSTNLLPADAIAVSLGNLEAGIGTDVFGHIVEVGANVKCLWPDCHVLVQMRDTIRTHVIVHQSRVRLVKHHGTWTNSCPTAFATALQALQTPRLDLGGESILVYGALSAYGQAALRLATVLRMEILVACASAAERKFVRETFRLPDSSLLKIQGPDGMLESQVLAATHNRGVDVVFDPTSQHIEQAFRCVTEGGRIMRVAWAGCDAPSIQLPSSNASLETVNLELLEKRRPLAMESLAFNFDQTLEIMPSLCALSEAVEYKMSNIDEALRAVAADPFGRPRIVATGVGSPTPTKTKVNMAVNLTQKTELSSSGTYLLIGGLGGLGRAIAYHLVASGARHIAFFSRSGASSAGAQDLLSKLNVGGVDARAFAVDITDEALLADGLYALGGCMPPIQGAIQCAAVVEDALFANMDYDSWRKSFAPKTAGSYNLHRHLPRDMDFFVFLSSLSGVIGNRGQANYAAGNSFQDALAQHRSGQGMHSVSLDFGLVLGAGMVSEDERLLDAMRANGFLGTRLQDMLFVLDRAMAKPGKERVGLPMQVITTAGTGGLVVQNQPSDPFWTRAALFRYLNQVDAPVQAVQAVQAVQGSSDQVGGSSGGGGGGNLRTWIESAGSVEHAAPIVCTAVMATLARRKGMVPDDFEPEQLLSNYGMDSLDSMFILGWISRETGVTVQTIDGMTIAELSHSVARRSLEALHEEEEEEEEKEE